MLEVMKKVEFGFELLSIVHEVGRMKVDSAFAIVVSRALGS